jgi:hypothetical protein
MGDRMSDSGKPRTLWDALAIVGAVAGFLWGGAAGLEQDGTAGGYFAGALAGALIGYVLGWAGGLAVFVAYRLWFMFAGIAASALYLYMLYRNATGQ